MVTQIFTLNRLVDKNLTEFMVDENFELKELVKGGIFRYEKYLNNNEKPDFIITGVLTKHADTFYVFGKDKTSVGEMTQKILNFYDVLVPPKISVLY